MGGHLVTETKLSGEITIFVENGGSKDKGNGALSQTSIVLKSVHYEQSWYLNMFSKKSLIKRLDRMKIAELSLRTFGLNRKIFPVILFKIWLPGCPFITLSIPFNLPVH